MAYSTQNKERTELKNNPVQSNAGGESFSDKRSSTRNNIQLQALMATSSVQEKSHASVQFMASDATQKKLNNTGLPDNLKAGIEALSGMSMDHVKVNYNSDKPAQLQAHVYAQGNEIHLAPGQEQHLPHEAWHVVQQAQGRVRPTVQMKAGMPVNDDTQLEAEADVMGAQAAQFMSIGHGAISSTPNATRLATLSASPTSETPMQLMATSQIKDFEQAGGTCGLYSLGMAISGVDSSVVSHRDKLLELLLKTGNQVGTFVGEFMDANNLAEVARKLGLTVSVIGFSDVDDFKAKLIGTGSNGVVMGYSVFDVPIQSYSSIPRGLSAFKHLFSHWSVIEALNSDKLTVRDPNSPGSTRETPIADFYQSNQDADHSSGKFDFKEFQDNVGQSVGDLRSLWESEELDKRANKTKAQTPIGSAHLPTPKLDLKGKIVSVGGSVTPALVEKPYKLKISNGSNDEVGGEFTYTIRLAGSKCEMGTGNVRSGGTVNALAECEINIASLMSGGTWIKIDKSTRQIIPGNYAIDFE